MVKKNEEKKAKKWYSTWWGITLIVFGSLIIFSAIIGAISNNSSPTTSYSQSSNVDLITPPSETISDEPVQVDTTPKTYTMGNPFLVGGNIEINVEKITFVKNIFESDNEYFYLRSGDEQMYVILDISLKNVSNNVQSIYFPSPELLDQDSYSYKYEIFDASTSIKNSISFSESILPQSIKRGRLLFKVPENVISLKLVFNNTPYVYTVDLPVQNKEVWFSTTDKEKPVPVMDLRIKEISSYYSEYFNGGTISSISFNITDDSNYPIDDKIIIKGRITNPDDEDIDIYFEKVITMYNKYEEEFVSISEGDLDPEYGYKVDMNLYVGNALIDHARKTFALSD